MTLHSPRPIRRAAYLTYAKARGILALSELDTLERQYARGIPPDAAAIALTGLLQHCQRYVKHYRDILGVGSVITPDNVFDVLRSLPLLSKDVVRSQFANLTSDDLATRRWFYNTSGGSTGEPVRLVQDREYADRARASALWVYRRMGYEFGDRLVRIWGDEREVLRQELAATRRVRRWLYHSEDLNAFNMSPERMRGFIALLNRQPVRLVVAYAQAAYELARFAGENGLRIAPPHAMTTSAGTLYGFMRERISAAFGCPVYNYYGSREVGVIATELPGREGMWVPPWSQFVEVLDQNDRPCPPGVEGEIVVTSLLNRAMPLVRYRIGDRGALLVDQPSDQSLTTVTGRVVDTFLRADGGLVDGEFFTHLLYHRDWVRKFQFVQRSPRLVELRVVPSSIVTALSEAHVTGIAAAVREAMGPDCELRLLVVDEIPPMRSGKYRYTVRAFE